jgi:hypothetical protein
MKTLLDSRIARLLAASALAAAVGVMTLPSTAEAAWHGGGGYAGHGYGGGWHGGWGGGYHGGYGGYGYRGGYGWHGGWGWGPGVVGGALLGLGVGAAIAGAYAPPPYYAPGYYAPPPAYYAQPGYPGYYPGY